MAKFLTAGPDTEHDEPTLDDAPTLPEWAIIREINFKIEPGQEGESDDELVMYYSKYSRDVRLNPPGQSGDFASVLKAVCKPNYVFEGGPSNPASPYATKLSLNGKNRLSYVIFKLADRRWQFAQKGRPIKIGDAGTLAQAYYDAHRVNEQGVADKGDNPNVIRPGCKVAYFISDGPKAQTHGSYPHPFNLYVDLLVSGGDPMPLRIDPDIRNPGGSSE